MDDIDDIVTDDTTSAPAESEPTAAAADDDPYLEALRFERLGYERRNLPDRVAQVDEQIRLRGGRTTDNSKPRTTRKA